MSVKIFGMRKDQLGYKHLWHYVCGKHHFDMTCYVNRLDKRIENPNLSVDGHTSLVVQHANGRGDK
jgi:hypothetical protein